MQKLFGVYCTDGKAKDGSSFSVSALEDMIWQGSEGRPLGISHDFNRLVGWNMITGLYMSHEMSYVVGNSYLPETNAEYKRIANYTNDFYLDYQIRTIEKYKAAFMENLSEHDLLTPEGKFLYNGIALYGYTNILYRAFPYLADLADNDSMIRIKDLLNTFKYIGQGVFVHKKNELAVVLHPYFRRSFSRMNNYNFGFLKLLMGLYEEGNDSIKLLLDPDFIGFGASYIQSAEYDYWYGPKYTDDIENIPEGLCRLENSEQDHFYNNVKSTEFIWQKKDDGDNYQFEMEEVVDESSHDLADDVYGCKYLHAFYNLKTKEFNHFDGAIRSYSFEQMYKRIETPMDKMGHEAQYQKIFRIDGIIPLDKWKGIITQYLSSNPLVYDYFNIKRPFISPKDEVKSENKLSNYVPYILTKGDGVRVLLSYTYQQDQEDEDREFVVTDIVSDENGNESFAGDFAIIEVYKALIKVGAEIKLPENIIYHLTEDRYNYIPCIHHSGSDVGNNIRKTLDGIRLLVSQHVKNNDDDIYSFSISWKINDKIACVAFMGHVDDLNGWLKSFSSIPTDRVGLKEWLQKQNDYLHHHGKDSENPLNSNHIKSDGVLFFKRHDIKEHTTIQNPNIENGNLNAEICDQNQYLKNLITDGDIKSVPYCIVYDAIDNKCGQSYFNTKDSSVFNETTYTLKDFKLMGFYWAYNNIHK